MLHLRLFLFLQLLNQYAVADMFEQKLISMEAVKAFPSYVRCANLPDAEKMEAERDAIE